MKKIMKQVMKQANTKYTNMKQVKRNELLFTALRILGHGSMVVVTLIDALIASRTPGSRYETSKRLMKRIDRRHDFIDQAVDYLKAKKQFYNLLYRLKQDGLIERQGQGWAGTCSLTPRGKQKSEDSSLSPLSLGIHHAGYSVNASNALIVVSFDISEKERPKRDWLRSALKNMNFTMAHKSMWTGMFKLPENFIADLKRLDLLSSVKIFSVSKTGTLEEYIFE